MAAIMELRFEPLLGKPAFRLSHCEWDNFFQPLPVGKRDGDDGAKLRIARDPVVEFHTHLFREIGAVDSGQRRFLEGLQRNVTIKKRCGEAISHAELRFQAVRRDVIDHRLKVHWRHADADIFDTVQPAL